MGNCQAAEAATVVIQHPSGKVDRLYWPTTAEEIMKSNPGHHVAIVTLCIAKQKQAQESTSSGSGSRSGGGHVRFTRVRLLKPKDMLLVGQVYRLITSQEVNKALRERKHEKMKRTQQAEMMRKQRQQEPQTTPEIDNNSETTAVVSDDQEEQKSRSSSTNTHTAAAVSARLRLWRPSLQSISEGVI